MSLSTLRPTSTGATTGSVSVVGTSHHAATSDDDVGTYAQFDTIPSSLTLGLGDFTLPAGAVIRRLVVRLQTSTNSGALLAVDLESDLLTGSLFVSWGSPTTVTVSTTAQEADPEDAQVDSATLVVALQAGGTTQLYAAYVDVYYVTEPVVDVTAPTGTIDTNGPTVTWSDTLDSEGGAQTKYEVKVFDDATYGGGGFDPDTATPTVTTGEVASSATSRQVTVPLADDTYRAYVRVAQSVNGADFWSDWDYIEFTVDAVIPGTPLVHLTGQDDQGRIRIDIAETGTADETDRFEIQRLTDGEYVAIRTLLGDGLVAETAGGANVYDYEAPNGISTTYRVRAVGDTSDGPTYSAWVTASASWSSSDWWLKHPTDPDFNCPVVPDSVPSIERDARQGAFAILGARYPVVVDDARGGPSGTITFRLDTAEEQAALVAILEECVTVLLQGRAFDNWTDRWVRFGDQESTRIVDKSWIEPTYETLPWIEVAEPTDNLGEWLGEGS